MKQPPLPLDKFYQFEQQLADQIYLRQPINGKWIEYDWASVGLEARRFASALIKLNLPPNTCIAIISKNCAHWLIADLGIWMAGHISVPIYPTSISESINYVLKHCEAPFLIVGKLDQWRLQKDAVPSHVKMVSFPFWENEGTESWESFLGNAKPLQGNQNRPGNDVATIIYTSGTTGNPKGVVHTFKSMSYYVEQAINAVKITPKDRFISYLPLSHVAERLLIELGSLYTGGVVSFAESVESFNQNLKEVRPTIFLAVPRIWLKFQQAILQKIPQKKLSILLSIPIVNSLIKNKIKKGLGLDQVHIAFTGAAAISKELLEWFEKIGLPIHEVYGMTENFCVTSFNFPGKARFGSVGTFWDETKVKISEKGEILTSSHANMKGYYKSADLSAEAIDSEGWLHTGDQGEIDHDGYLKITGRVKDLFKTSKGKYVAPTHIEGLFEMCDAIDQVCVVGSGLPQPLALVVLSEKGKGLDSQSLKDLLMSEMNRVNQLTEGYERLSAMVVLKDNWSVETGILTPTLKIKRNVIEKKYASQFDAWAASTDKVILV